MDKDKFETQSGGHIKEGHQESDISVKGVVWSGVILAVGGVLFIFPDSARDDQMDTGALGKEPRSQNDADGAATP